MNYFTIRSIITLIILGISLLIFIKYKSKKKYIMYTLCIAYIISLECLFVKHSIIYNVHIRYSGGMRREVANKGYS